MNPRNATSKVFSRLGLCGMIQIAWSPSKQKHVGFVGPDVNPEEHRAKHVHN